MSNPICLFLENEQTHYPCISSLLTEVQWNTPGAQRTRAGIGRGGNWAFYFAHFSLGAASWSWSPRTNTNTSDYTSVVHQREQPGLLWEWQQRFMPIKLMYHYNGRWVWNTIFQKFSPSESGKQTGEKIFLPVSSSSFSSFFFYQK